MENIKKINTNNNMLVYWGTFSSSKQTTLLQIELPKNSEVFNILNSIFNILNSPAATTLRRLELPKK